MRLQRSATDAREPSSRATGRPATAPASRRHSPAEWASAGLLLGFLAALLAAAVAGRAGGHYSWERPPDQAAAGAIDPDEVRQQLRKVSDRELDVDIVDLGLIYGIGVSEGGRVAVVMTLTAASCPYGRQLVGDVRRVLLDHPAVRRLELTVTFDPPWSLARVAPQARRRLLEGPLPAGLRR